MAEFPRYVRRLLPSGRMTSGLGAGYRSCDCLPLPRRRQPPTEEEMALRLLPLAGKVVYDIGANVGTFTLFFSGQVGPRGRVVAFEPEPVNHAKLLRNLALNRVTNVTTFAIALSERAGELAAYAVAGQRGITSLDRIAGVHGLCVSAGVVPVESLDRAIPAHRLPPPALLKIDVEGTEVKVLLGAERTLRRARPMLFVELHGDGIEQKACAAAALLDVLAGFHYRAVHVETAAPITARGFVPGAGHWLCLPE